MAEPEARNYASISPSAISLLFLKSQTQIPYAREAAALVWPNAAPDELIQSLQTDVGRLRMRHFEARYRSLDRLLAESGLPRVLELGAGLSFRGLAFARTPGTFYLDTDLPDLIATKRDLIRQLAPAALPGTLRVEALNALDEAAVFEALEAMPPGPLAIANEGLLMYLDEVEKARLAATVRRVLERRGGVWLTADIYIRNPQPGASAFIEDRARRFLEEHGVERKKFADFPAAERFFTENGFAIHQRVGGDRPERIRESWALTLRAAATRE